MRSPETFFISLFFVSTIINVSMVESLLPLSWRLVAAAGMLTSGLLLLRVLKVQDQKRHHDKRQGSTALAMRQGETEEVNCA